MSLAEGDSVVKAYNSGTLEYNLIHVSWVL